nr:hypothetical protein [Pandoravirus belohorizontensis]
MRGPASASALAFFDKRCFAKDRQGPDAQVVLLSVGPSAARKKRWLFVWPSSLGARAGFRLSFLELFPHHALEPAGATCLAFLFVCFIPSSLLACAACVGPPCFLQPLSAPSWRDLDTCAQASKKEKKNDQSVMDDPTYDQDLCDDADYDAPDDAGGDDQYGHGRAWGTDGALQEGEAVYEMAADDSAEAAADDGGLPTDCTDQVTAVRLFCARWDRLKTQLDPLAAATRGIRTEQTVLKRDLAAYMESARVRRAIVDCGVGAKGDGAVIVVRVDPTRPTTSMKRPVITNAIYEHVTPDLVRACATAATAAAEKRSAKAAKAKATAARKAARAAAAAARPAKRRRRTAKRDDEQEDDAPVETPAPAVVAGSVAVDEDTVGADGCNAPTLADILGAAVVEATRVAQRCATAQQTTLTVGLYDPDRDDESAMADTWDAAPSASAPCEALCPGTPRHPGGGDDADNDCGGDDNKDNKADGHVNATSAYAWSTTDVPPEVRGWAMRFVELADVLSGLRDRMRPLEVAIEALTLDLPPPAPEPHRTSAKATARGKPSARAIEAAAKRERHGAFEPMRDAVAQYLAGVGADKRGVPVRFPASPALYRLRASVRTRTGTLARTDYVPLAANAAAAAMAQIEIDPAMPYSPEAAADLLEDDEFRNRLFDAVADGIDQHRERGTVRTRAVSLVRVSAGRDPTAPPPPPDA